MNRFIGFGVLAVLLTLAPVGAGAFTQLYRFQYCSSIPDRNDRLECYDNYALELGLPPPGKEGGISATQTTKGKWTVRGESTLDSSTVFVFTEGVSDYGHGRQMLVPTLVARCTNRTTELFLSFSSYFPVQVGPQEKSSLYAKQPSLGAKTIQVASAMVKFEGRQGIQIDLTEGTDGRTYFFANPVSFIRQLENSPRMEFIGVSPNHQPLEAVFSLEGFETALEPLRKQCEW